MPVLRSGSAGFTTGTSSTTLSPVIPAGAGPGDTICIWAATSNAGFTWTVPGSPAFTAQTACSGTGGSAQLFTRVMDGTEGWTPGTSTVTLTISSAKTWNVIIFAVGGTTGPDQALATNGSGHVNAASTSVTAAGVTTTVASDLLIWLGSVATASSGTPATITVPSGYTAQTAQVSTHGTGAINAGSVMASATAGAPGATGSVAGSESPSSFASTGLLLSFAAGGLTEPTLEPGTSVVTTGASSATAAFTIPSGVQDGDTIVLFCAAPNASVTWSSGSGSTAFTAQAAASGTSGASQLLTHAYTGTEGWTPGTTTVTVTASASHPWNGVICAVTGTSGPDPALSGSGQVNTTSATLAVAGVTTTQAPDLLLWFGWEHFTTGVTPVAEITVPSGFTGIVTEKLSSGSGVANIGLIAATGSAVTAGATGSQNGTLSGAQVNGGLLISFAPAGGASLTASAATGITALVSATAAVQSGGTAAAGITAVVTATAQVTAPIPVTVSLAGSASFAFPLTAGGVPAPGTRSLPVPVSTSPGDWLFAVISWHQPPGSPGVTFSVADDAAGAQGHNWWDPLGAPSGTSAPEGVTRTAIWYAPAARPCSNVYVAPTGFALSVCCTVLDVSGMAPGVTFEGVSTAFSNAATALPALALGAPSAQALVITAASYDVNAAGTVLSGSGWTSLPAVTAANGTDATSDCKQRVSYQLATGATSATWSSTATEDISGVIAAVLTQGLAPGQPSRYWPGTIAEMAPGSGIGSAPDTLSWTPTTARYLKMGATQGRQYELAQLSTGEGTLLLDNPDGALLPPGTGDFAGITSGTPYRLRTFWPGGAWQVSFTGNGSSSGPKVTTGQIFGASAGNAYSASMWLSCSPFYSPGVHLTMNFRDITGTILSSVFSASITGLLAELATVTGTAPAGTALIDLSFGAAGTPPSSVTFYAAAAPP